MSTEKTALIHAYRKPMAVPDYVRVAVPTSAGNLEVLEQKDFLKRVVGPPRLKVTGYSKLLGTPKPPPAARYTNLGDSYPPGVGVLLRMQDLGRGPADLEFPFVLYYDLTTDLPNGVTNLGELQSELLEKGWNIVCQETLAEERADGLTFVLVKLHKSFT